MNTTTETPCVQQTIQQNVAGCQSSTGFFRKTNALIFCYSLHIFIFLISLRLDIRLSSHAHLDLDELDLLNLHLLSSPQIAPLCPLLFSLQRFLSSALRDSFRERQQLDPASSQALDGPPGSSPTPGMTLSHRGPSSQPTAASSTSSSAALAPNLGHSLCHHNSSGWEPLRASCIFSFLHRRLFFWSVVFFF